jgi:hypothetical protein
VLLTDVQPVDAAVARLREAGLASSGLSGDVANVEFVE